MRVRCLAVGSLVALGACTPTTSEPPPAPSASPSSSSTAAPVDVPRGGTIRFGVYGEPPTLDPYSPLATDLTYALVRPVYPSLFAEEPGTAIGEELEIRSPRSALVTLKRARWSDGRAITSADVVASVARALPPSGLAGLRATADGRRGVVLRGRVKDWFRRLSRGAFVLPRGRAARGVSGGPMRIVSQRPGLEVVLRRNPRYEPGSHLDGVVIRHVVGTEMLLALLDAGRLDAAWVPSSVNLGERLDELGLEHEAAFAGERVGLDVRSGAADPSGLLALVRPRPLATGFIRDEGRLLTEGLGSPGQTPGSARLGSPAGDELLELIQRVVQVQLETEDVDTDLVSGEPSRFYGEWSKAAPFELAVHRGTLHRPSHPLFLTQTFLVWRDGRAGGLDPRGAAEGPLWNVSEWFVPDGGS